MEGSGGGPGCQGNRREGRAVKSSSKCCQVTGGRQDFRYTLKVSHRDWMDLWASQ